jgi:hypothetical protein
MTQRTFAPLFSFSLMKRPLGLGWVGDAALAALLDPRFPPPLLILLSNSVGVIFALGAMM